MGGDWGEGEVANNVVNGTFPLTPTLPRKGGGRFRAKLYPLNSPF
jgi:hypothetical protein